MGPLRARLRTGVQALVLVAIVACKKEKARPDADIDPCGPMLAYHGPVTRALPAAGASGMWGPVKLGMARCSARDALVRAGFPVRVDPGIKGPSSYVSVDGEAFHATIYFDETTHLVNQITVLVDAGAKDRADGVTTGMTQRFGAPDPPPPSEREWLWGEPSATSYFIVTHRSNGSVEQRGQRGGSKRDSVGWSTLTWGSSSDEVLEALRRDGYEAKSEDVVLEPCNTGMGNPNPKCGEKGPRVSFSTKDETGAAELDRKAGLDRFTIELKLAGEARTVDVPAAQDEIAFFVCRPGHAQVRFAELPAAREVIGRQVVDQEKVLHAMASRHSREFSEYDAPIPHRHRRI